MKITIRVTNAYPRAALDIRPSPPEIPPPAEPPVAEKTSLKGDGVKTPPEATDEATSIAVAKELNRLRSIAGAASAAKKKPVRLRLRLPLRSRFRSRLRSQ
jgi:hypothetical protein